MSIFFKFFCALVFVFGCHSAVAQPFLKKGGNERQGRLKFVCENHSGNNTSAYSARVQRRSVGITDFTNQRCDTILSYEPGNYYLEINTLPLTRYSVDIDSGSDTEIPIPGIGALSLRNLSADAVITLYFPLRDKMVAFYNQPLAAGHTLDLSLKIGHYMARYSAINSGASKDTATVRFQVLPDKKTTVFLPR